MTNKTKKLNYIREKNGYRSGRTALYFFKVTDQVYNDDDDSFDCMLMTESTRAVIELDRKYKLSFRVCTIESGLDGNDFVNRLQTIKFSLTAKH